MAEGGAILIVEDDTALADMYALVLRRQGWRVEVAADGATGARRALEPGIRLVLLDLGLPDRSGLEVLDEIRSRPAGDAVLIVVFSNSDDPDLVESAMRRGASGHLLKADVTPSALVTKIAQLMS